MRTFRVGTLVRKIAGLVLAVIGIAIVIYNLPRYIWVLLLGFGLIWAGWLVFQKERIY